MEKKQADIQTLSGQDKILRFVEKVNPPLMIFFAIVLGLTSDNPMITVPLCILPPVVGTLGFRVARKFKWQHFPLFMTLFAATLIFFIAWKSGPHAPTFLAGYTNIVFAVFNIRKILYKTLAILLVFFSIISGCLLAGMDYFYLFTGLLCLAAYLFVLVKVMNFILGLGNEIAQHRDEIEKQKELVEEQQKELKDSIHYAHRIQKALLASDNMLNTNLDNFFVLFQPKDIVSGDFYWATKAHNKFYFAIADSTGHGVPGAFMSLLNISFLNEAITEKQIIKPAEILNHVRSRLMQALKDDGSEEGGKDGMDCTLLAFDNTSGRLEFAGANNSLLLIRNKEAQSFPADRMPVGRSPHQDKPFTNHELQLQKGDTIYASTDGYYDQFGGPKGKKFKYKQMETLIMDAHHLPVNEQKQILSKAISDWKGNLEQVDDILLTGIIVQ